MARHERRDGIGWKNVDRRARLRNRLRVTISGTLTILRTTETYAPTSAVANHPRPAAWVVHGERVSHAVPAVDVLNGWAVNLAESVISEEQDARRAATRERRSRPRTLRFSPPRRLSSRIMTARGPLYSRPVTLYIRSLPAG